MYVDFFYRFSVTESAIYASFNCPMTEVDERILTDILTDALK